MSCDALLLDGRENSESVVYIDTGVKHLHICRLLTRCETVRKESAFSSAREFNKYIYSSTVQIQTVIVFYFGMHINP